MQMEKNILKYPFIIQMGPIQIWIYLYLKTKIYTANPISAQLAVLLVSW